MVPVLRLSLRGVPLLLLLLSACRPVAVETDPGPTYVLDVENPMAHPMIVSYDDTTGSRLLGTVAAHGQTRFVISRPARTTVTVVASDEDRTMSVRREVTLRADTAVRVTLNP